jgi:hypothetical protein
MDTTIKMPQQDTIPTLDLDDIRTRNAAARQLLQEWLADASGYDEETWPLLKGMLEADRTAPTRKLFRA